MNILTRNEPRTVTPTQPRRSVTPYYELRENQDAYIVTAHVSGVERSSLETTVNEENLTVLGRRAWSVPENWTAVHREIPQADYKLVLELDHRINRNAIQAELSQGVLTLTIPKAEVLKSRKIEIKG